MLNKATIKKVLGEIPLTAEIYWLTRQSGKPIRRNISMQKLNKRLPELMSQAQSAAAMNSSQKHNLPGKRILIFATLRYWIEHATLLALALAGQGHQVTLAYLPYVNWRKNVNLFDLRRQDIYIRSILDQTKPLLKILPLLDFKPKQEMPSELARSLDEVTLRDIQYTLQIEEVDQLVKNQPEIAQLYQLRLKRNQHAAKAIFSWVENLPEDQRPQILLTPNGSILEMGAVYQAARYLDIATVTYEFGEQRGRIWFAQDGEVMQQETDQMWSQLGVRPLNSEQWEKIRSLYTARQNASLWQNFARLWQEQPSQGGEKIRKALDLDERPVVLLAANVIGDSLTLGRQVFSKNMTEWLEKTAKYFAQRQDVQFIIRIHPGERYTTGPSVAQIVRQALPEVPAHMRLVEALDPVNTYDLIEIANLGLVYTTTVGMEMAMSGVPVIVAGKTHYRNKGFTLDPQSWEDFIAILEERRTSQAHQPLAKSVVEKAWLYAYHFFFDYPAPFPWHLKDSWEMLDTWSMERVLSLEGQNMFGETFRNLAGEPRQWIVSADLYSEAQGGK